MIIRILSFVTSLQKKKKKETKWEKVALVCKNNVGETKDCAICKRGSRW